MLSGKYADVRVREYAVKQLDSLRNDKNNEFDYYIYIPQLLQALKSEFYHYSALACLLIRKALFDLRIAHITFWQLRVMIHFVLLLIFL